MTTDQERFQRWLQEQDRASRTVRAYTVALRDFATWFQHTTGNPLTPTALTPLDVREYRQHLTAVRRLKPATVNQYLAGVRAYARWAKATGLITDNPTNGIRSLRQVDTAPRWLSRSEQYKLLRTVREAVQLGTLRAQGQNTAPGYIWPRRDACLVVLLLNTGLRLSEVAALTLKDVEINDRSGTVRVRQGKGRQTRSVPLNKDSRTVLTAWLSVRPETDSAALWLSQKGGPLSARAISGRVNALAHQAGLEGVSPHTLRHSFAKNLVDAGVGLEKVATLLGHTNLNTTRIYITPSQADLQQATEKVAWED